MEDKYTGVCTSSCIASLCYNYTYKEIKDKKGNKTGTWYHCSSCDK